MNFNICDRWKVFETLQVWLRSAAIKARLSKEEVDKYVISVTHEEVANGILRNPMQDKQSFCFMRRIEGLEEEKNWNGSYVDMKNGKRDEEAQSLLGQLKEEILARKGKDAVNVVMYKVSFHRC